MQKLLIKTPILWIDMPEKGDDGVGWYDMFKDVLSAAQKADNVELIKQLLELQRELQDMQQSNFELMKEVANLKEELKLKNQMQYDSEHNYYYAVIDQNTKDGPFCPRCWEKESKLARLAKFGYDKKCNVCQCVIGEENQRRAIQDSVSFF